MGLEISGANRIPNAYLSGFNLQAPNWENIPHKGMKVPSKEELMEQMKENGKKTFATTDHDELKALAEQREKLCAQYMSTVSPDRKALYRDAMQVINSTPAGKQTQAVTIKSFVDVLNEKDGIKTNLTNVPASLPSGGSIIAAHTVGGGFEYYVSDTSGKEVMGTSGNKWCYTVTSKELEKSKEIMDVYQSAKKAARINHELGLDSVDSQPTNHFVRTV